MLNKAPVLPTPDELKSIADAVDKYQRIADFWQPYEGWPEPDVALAFRLRSATGGAPVNEDGTYMLYRQRADGSLAATLTLVMQGYGTPGPGWICVRAAKLVVDEGPSRPGLFRFCGQRWEHEQMVMKIRDHGGRYKGK